jgi:hypothetical protein
MSLTNIDLINIAKKMKINLIAVVSKDELSKIPHKTGGYIINLQNNHDGQGTHWVSFIIYQKNNNIYRCIYFDPYGIPPPIEVEQYIKQLNDLKILSNKRQVQKINTTECGWYALSWLYNMQYKRRSINIIDDFSDYISKFSNNLNDELKILKASFNPFIVNFYNKTITLKKIT